MLGKKIKVRSRRRLVFGFAVSVSIALAAAVLQPAAVASAAEKYQLLKQPNDFLIIAQLSVKNFTQTADCSGDINGKVDFISIEGRPLELATKDIVHEEGKAWIVTKGYGKIRISGGYAGDHPPSGLCWWLTPSQQATFKKFNGAK